VSVDVGGLLAKMFGGDIGDMFSKIVGTFKLSPEKAAELESLKLTHAYDLAKLQLQMESDAQAAITKEVEEAGLNIRAEAQNGDKYTSRARPTFLYICEFILFWNYVFVPLWGKTPIEFPPQLFWLFGSVMLGYVGARSWEKIAAIKGA
jgi:hypothetical protein